MNRNEAFSIFRLHPPCSITDLKTAFREMVKLHHPDHGGKPEDFILIKKAYDFLKDDSSIINDDRTIITTINGHKLEDLGLGLGPTRNGITCEECKGKGYRQKYELRRKACSYCEGTGYEPQSFVCQACSGTGIFDKCYPCKGTGKINDNICRKCNGTGKGSPVPCRICDGSGKTKPEKVESEIWNTWGGMFDLFGKKRQLHKLCRHCLGSGQTEKIEEIHQFETCYLCKGTGEIEILNPVLPKGRLG